MNDTLNQTRILEYEPGLAGYFKQLNIDWIEKFFKVEPHDLEQLDNPDHYIIDKGGYIFFVECNGEIAGTCALIKTGEKEYELAKMGVSEKFQGKQLGKKLGIAAVEKAKELEATKLWLESNRRLTTALNLYRSLGFVEVPSIETPYARADIRMEMWF